MVDRFLACYYHFLRLVLCILVKISLDVCVRACFYGVWIVVEHLQRIVSIDKRYIDLGGSLCCGRHVVTCGCLVIA